MSNLHESNVVESPKQKFSHRHTTVISTDTLEVEMRVRSTYRDESVIEILSDAEKRIHALLNGYEELRMGAYSMGCKCSVCGEPMPCHHRTVVEPKQVLDEIRDCLKIFDSRKVKK